MDVDRLIGLALGNVPVIGLVLAFVIPLCLETHLRAERLLGYVLLLGLGLPLLWAAWWHLARPVSSAQMIGLEPSPFQREVGLADLALGLVACVAPTRPMPFKGAIVWTAAIALGGDAAGQIAGLVSRRDLAGLDTTLLWAVAAPLAALVLLVMAAHRRRPR